MRISLDRLASKENRADDDAERSDEEERRA
jgi:hypothetical protein